MEEAHMLSTNIFGDLYDLRQNYEIEQAKSIADRANGKANLAQEEINALNWKVEKLTMITEALWRIVKQSRNIDDEYLKRLVDEIDMKDGKLDGKIAKTPPLHCSNCLRVLSNRIKKCVYCGTVSNGDLFK